MPVFTFTTIDVSRSGTTGTSVSASTARATSLGLSGTLRATTDSSVSAAASRASSMVRRAPRTPPCAGSTTKIKSLGITKTPAASTDSGAAAASPRSMLREPLQSAHPTSTTQGRSSGGFSDGHAFHDFVRFSSGLTGIIDGPTGTTNTVVRGINDRGAKVGSYQDASDGGFRRRRRRQLNCSGAGRRTVTAAVVYDATAGVTIA